MPILLMIALFVAGTPNATVCSLERSESRPAKFIDSQGFEVSVRGGFSQVLRPFRILADSTGSGSEATLQPDCQWRQRKFKLAPADVRRINALLLAATSSPLQDRYVVPGTDGQPIELSFWIRGKEYHVFEYGGASVGLPKSLIELERALKGLRQTAPR